MNRKYAHFPHGSGPFTADQQARIDTRDALILQWRWLPKHFVSKHWSWKQVRLLGYEPSIAAAYYGMLQAAERYDESIGSFSTYAQSWMYNSVNRDASRVGAIHVPQYVKDRLSYVSDFPLDEIEQPVSAPSINVTQLTLVKSLTPKLTAREQQVFHLVIEQGLSLLQAAEIMGTSKAGISNFKTNLTRKLRKFIKGADHRGADTNSPCENDHAGGYETTTQEAC